MEKIRTSGIFDGAIASLINRKLASLFDKVRVSSPLAYLIILVVIFGGSAVIENAADMSEHAPWLFNGITSEVIKGLAAILLSSRTKRHLSLADDGVDNVTVMDIDHDD